MSFFFFFFFALCFFFSLIRLIPFSHFAHSNYQLRQPKPFPPSFPAFFIPVHHNRIHSTCASFQCLPLKVTVQRHVHDSPVQLTPTRGTSVTACVCLCVCVRSVAKWKKKIGREEHISDCHVCVKCTLSFISTMSPTHPPPTLWPTHSHSHYFAPTTHLPNLTPF